MQREDDGKTSGVRVVATREADVPVTFSMSEFPTDAHEAFQAEAAFNRGEARFGAYRVQMRVDDPADCNPYVCIELTVDRIDGSIEARCRDDRRCRTVRESFSALTRNDTESGALLASLTERAVELLERHPQTRGIAAAIAEAIASGAGIGCPRFAAGPGRELERFGVIAPTFEEIASGGALSFERRGWYVFIERPGPRTVNYLIARSTGTSMIMADEIVAEIDPEGAIMVTRSGDGSFRVRPATVTMARIRERLSGAAMPVRQDLVDEIGSYITPPFTESEDVVELPRWSEPLDSIENCVECLVTERFVSSATAKLVAAIYLLTHRDALQNEVGFEVPEAALDAKASPVWRTVIEQTESRGLGGRFRAIVPSSHARNAREMVHGYRLALGDGVLVTPADARYRHPVISFSIDVIGGETRFIVTDGKADYDMLMPQHSYPLDALEDWPAILDYRSKTMISIVSVDAKKGVVALAARSGWLMRNDD